MGSLEVSFQIGHEPYANHGMRISSTNNEMRSSAPRTAPVMTRGQPLPTSAPSGDEMLSLGKDNRNFECVLHSTPVLSISQQPLLSIPQS
jgi:hypothetical protein